MKQQRFHEIMDSVRQTDFYEVLALTKLNFQHVYPGKEGRAFFKCEFRCNWNFSIPKTVLLPDEIVPFMTSLSENAVFCLDNFDIIPMVAFTDSEGREQEFQACAVSLQTGNGIYRQYFHFSGDVGPHWQELRLRFIGKGMLQSQVREKEISVARSSLHAGCVVADTPVGELKVLKMDDSELTLITADGTEVVELCEKRAYNREVFSGVEAMLLYDNEEHLHTVAQHMEKAFHYYGEQEVPAGCRVTMMVRYDGKEDIYVEDVRSLYCYLKPNGYEGVSWNWPCAWGFIDGKMVVGNGNPSDRYTTFLGLAAEGETVTFLIDDKWRIPDDDNLQVVKYAEMTFRWQNVEMDFEVEDGMLHSVPDQEEITIPAEVSEIYYEALLTAPSLKRVTIHSGVKQFSWAIEEFYHERHRKLDVVFEGSVADWFVRAVNLSNSIDKLYIDGEERQFYNQKVFEVPKGVTRIGKNFFEDNAVLERVVLGPEVVEIGENAFHNCRNLQSVKVLGPAEIESGAFWGCKALKDVYLADGVVSLGHGVFDFITTLESVFIPLSVKWVGRLSCQNDSNGWSPVFHCAAPSQPEGWVKDWNLAYYDPRFGLGHGYDYYHETIWGCKRR